MKIIFIVSSTYGVERLGVQILVSLAKDAGFETFFYSQDSMQEEELIRQIVSLKPEVIAYSAMTYEHFTLQDLNEKLKSKISFISIFGGSHYTFNPEEIDSNEYIDVVCVGEGENAFISFLQHVKDKSDYSKVSNLIVRRGKLLCRNPVGPLIEDLDKVPFADRKIIPLDTKGHRFTGKTCYVMVSRGCPYRCTYCFNSSYNEIYKSYRPGKLRWRSVTNVINEMERIKDEVPIDYFTINDDAFNLLPKDYIYEFCEMYKKEIALPFAMQFRADLCEEKIIKELKDAGMICANCGVETGDENVAKNLLKRGLTNDQIRNAFRIFNKYEIACFSQNIVGLPVEDPVENALKTIKLNIECKVTYAHFTLLVPLPKTPMEKFCKENGYLQDGDSHPGSLSPSVFLTSPLKFKNAQVNREINNLHKFCSIAVRYPFLLPLIKLLIKLPSNSFFKYIFFVEYGYNRAIKLTNKKLTISLVLDGMKQISSYLKRHA